MTHISTTRGGIRQSNLSIQVCTIQVHLTTVLVDNLARIRNAIFEHTERRRVGDLWNVIRLADGCGKVGPTINAAKLFLYFSAFALRSARSRFPSACVLIGTTFKPAITADYNDSVSSTIPFRTRMQHTAGLVP